jgi:putative oxidoreductase
VIPEEDVMNGRDLGLLLLRIGLGIVMLAHGAQKAFGWFGGPGMAGFVGGMRSLGVPAPIAWLAMLAELVGGAGVLLGAFTRLLALAVAVDMLGAIFIVHRGAGFFMNWGGVAGRGEGWEYAFAILAASLALVVAGPGRYAILDRER